MIKNSTICFKRYIQLFTCLANLVLNTLLFFSVTLEIILDYGGPHGYIKLLLFPLILIHLLSFFAFITLKKNKPSVTNIIVNLFVIIVCIIILMLRLL